MASVTEERGVGRDDRIAHPLAKLSSRIRGYVVAEGLLVAVILAAAWAWLDLAFDYGAFRLLTVDWVQVPGSWAFRLLMLAAVALVLGLYLLLRVVVRSVTAFSPRSLALVLEKRHPELLGDRLITAVELADIDEAERLGYSPAMVRMTIAEGAKRAEEIKVGSVLRWWRLWALGVTAAVLTVGVLLVVLLGVTVGNARAGTPNPFGRSVSQFSAVSSLWFKRNVLLMNRIWPRRAFIELVGFDPSGRLKIATDAPPPRIEAQAVKWVMDDPKSAEGLRAMTLGDLQASPPPKWLTSALPTLPLEDIRTVAKESLGVELATAESESWTLDRVQAVLERDEFRDRMLAQERGEVPYTGMQKVFDELADRASDPNASVPFRMLTVPAGVVVSTWGLNTSNKLPLDRATDNKFAGTLTELKESVWFTVRGEDYSTAPRQIMLVPPPRLATLTRTEERPAYLYHRPPLGDEGTLTEAARNDLLRGMKQSVPGVPRDPKAPPPPPEGVSLSGPASEVEVPFGTDVTLRATADKSLLSARLVPRPPKAVEGVPTPPTAPPSDLTVEADGFTVVAPFPDVRAVVDADIEFTDTDRIVGRRRVLIRPTEDRPPVVDVTVPVLRKTSEGIKVTKEAYIPFDGVVTDAVGLTKVEFESKYTELEAKEIVGRNAADAVGLIFNFLPEGNPVGPLAARFYLPAASGMLQGNGESEPTLTAVPRFTEEANFRAGGDVVLATLRGALTQPPADKAVLERRLGPKFEFKPELDEISLEKRSDREPDRVASFDLKRYVAWPRSKDNTALDALKRYKLQVAVVATDNNLLTGPRTGRNKETLTFIVVPEAELLGEINKDAETQTFKMRRELVEPMGDSRLKLAKAIELLPAVKEPSQLASQAVRLADVLETVTKGRDVAKEIYSDYGRIILEERLNRVTPEVYRRLEDNIYFPLDDVLRARFDPAESALKAVKDELDAGRVPNKEATDKATTKLAELVDELEAILKQMDEQVNYEKLVQDVTKLKFEVEIIGQVIAKAQKDAQDRILKQLADVEFAKAEPVTIEAGKKASVKLAWERVDWVWPVKLRFKGPTGGELKLPAETVTTAAANDITVEFAAGTKPGEYTVEAFNAEKPANKVDIKVTVK